MRHTISSPKQKDLPRTFEPKCLDFYSCCGRGQERITGAQENLLNWFAAGGAVCNPVLQHGQMPTPRTTGGPAGFYWRLPTAPTAPSAPEVA